MRRILFTAFLAAGVTFSGCVKKPAATSTPTEPSPPPPAAAPAEGAADSTAPPPAPETAPAAAPQTVDLAALNRMFKSYAATLDGGRKPKSLGELVAAGFVDKLPAPPPGKRFAIDYKKMEVVLEKE